MEKQKKDQACTGELKDMIQHLRVMSTPQKWERIFFRPIETINTIWLVYIILAQTLGWYQTCDCLASTWDKGGGYIDFNMRDNQDGSLDHYNLIATIITVSIVGVSMFYVTVEWCQQSFMSTEDYGDAMNGLRRTRTYKRWTFPIRYIWRAIWWILYPMKQLMLMFGLLKSKHMPLLWTDNHTWDPVGSPPPPEASNPNDNPAIVLVEPSDSESDELQDLDLVAHGPEGQLTLAPAHR